MLRLLVIVSIFVISCTDLTLNTDYTNDQNINTGDITMGTDYALAYTATATYDTDMLLSGLSNVNDNNDNTYAQPSYNGPSSGGGPVYVTIDFNGTHNIADLIFIIQKVAVPDLPSEVTFYYKKNDTWVLLDAVANLLTKTTKTYVINKKLQAIRVKFGAQSIGIGYVGDRVFSMKAIGYDSSGKLRMYDGNALIPIADVTVLTGMKVRHSDGVTVRGVPLMDAGDTVIGINDNGTIKSLAIVE